MVIVGPLNHLNGADWYWGSKTLPVTDTEAFFQAKHMRQWLCSRDVYHLNLISGAGEAWKLVVCYVSEHEQDSDKLKGGIIYVFHSKGPWRPLLLPDDSKKCLDMF